MKPLVLDALTAAQSGATSPPGDVGVPKGVVFERVRGFARFADRCSAFRITSDTLRTRRCATRVRPFCRGAIFARRRSSASTARAGRAAVRTTLLAVLAPRSWKGRWRGLCHCNNPA